MRPGNPADRFRTLALGCLAVLTAACTNERVPEMLPDSASLGSPILREGVVYTPAGIGSRRCVLYRVTIPGGNAPAALMYQSEDGEFSYGRPDRCVTKAGAR